MITEIQRDSIIKAIGKNHISKIYDWLKTTDFKSIYGREVSKGMISKVLNGTWDNEIIETAILDCASKKLYERKVLEEKKANILKQVS